MNDLEQYGLQLVRRAADRLDEGITQGQDWPNTDDELARLQGARLLRECAAELERLRSEVVGLSARQRALDAWKERGERLMQQGGALFAFGGWWADRPWRKRSEND